MAAVLLHELSLQMDDEPTLALSQPEARSARVNVSVTSSAFPSWCSSLQAMMLSREVVDRARSTE